MTILYLLSFVSMLIQIIFITLAIAAALYYIAELVEEYTVIAKKVITSMVIFSIVCYLLFIFFEKFPWSMIGCGLFAQGLHAIIMKNFPYVKFMSISFILTCILLIVNHYLAFVYFSHNHYPFTEVMGYFTLCLWIVPFALFVSLSANDNLLPTINERSPLLVNDDDIVTNYFSSKNKKLGLLSLFNYAKEVVLPQRNKKSY